MEGESLPLPLLDPALVPHRPIPAPPAPPLVLVDPFIIVASSLSAVSARVCTHPLDTIRIKVQTYGGASLPPLKDLIPPPRLRTLYAGLPVSIGLSVPALSLYLTTYEASKRFLALHLVPQDRKPTLLQGLPVFMLSGTAAELASGFLWTPLDVLKSRSIILNGTLSTPALFSKIWTEEGYRGIFRGYWISMVVFIPYISLYWTLYESFKTSFIPNYDAYKSSRSPSTPNSNGTGIGFTLPTDTLKYTACSVTACALSASLVNPIELVQTRWQTSAGNAKDGVRGIVSELYRQGGLKAFSRGLGAKIAYAIPANAISMTVYESLKQWKGI